MANEEHLRILKSGVEKWNEWRQTIAVRPDLSNAELTGMYLRASNLHACDLNFADLRQVDLTGADLREARLGDVNLNGAVLTMTDLRLANLTGAMLVGVDMQQANMTDAVIGWTTFCNMDLSRVIGLDKINHIGPSSIGLDTLDRSLQGFSNEQGVWLNSLETFLEHAGVSEHHIALLKSELGRPIQFYSAFISYSTRNQEFADRLYADLRQKAIRCWLATEDLKIGDKFRTRINEAIRIHDKLMVVLSEHSVKSAWVEDEVEAAFEREHRDGTTVLFPIRLDDAVMDSHEAWAASIRRTRHIGDFRKWKDHDEYQKALTRLIRDLHAEAASAAH